jgi:hypothetical protein
MPANRELLFTLLDQLMKSHGRTGGEENKEDASAPPPFQSPAEEKGGQDAAASDAKPRVVIPRAPRQPFSWCNEQKIAYAVNQYSPVGGGSNGAPPRREMYGRFGQRDANPQPGFSPPSGSHVENPTGDGPAGDSTQSRSRGRYSGYGGPGRSS